jgi:hypothetical protein
MNASVSGREALNGAAKPGRDLLEIDVFDGTKSVRTKNRCNADRVGYPVISNDAGLLQELFEQTGAFAQQLRLSRCLSAFPRPFWNNLRR